MSSLRRSQIIDNMIDALGGGADRVLADFLGLENSSISKRRTGARGIPHDELERVADASGWTVDQLLGRAPAPTAERRDDDGAAPHERVVNAAYQQTEAGHGADIMGADEGAVAASGTAADELRRDGGNLTGAQCEALDLLLRHIVHCQDCLRVCMEAPAVAARALDDIRRLPAGGSGLPRRHAP